MIEAEPAKIPEMVAVIANQVVGGVYDAKIQQAKGQIMAVRCEVDRLNDKSLSLAMDTAQKAYDSAEAALPGKKTEVQTALSARHDAYVAAAEAAGQKAGGGAQGERIRAAIEAIPKVQTVLARINNVTSAIVIPSYNESAGVGLNVAATEGSGAAPLLSAVGQLKGYQSSFVAKKTEWDARLKSLMDLENSFNVAGT
jgi:hypothetical protein